MFLISTVAIVSYTLLIGSTGLFVNDKQYLINNHVPVIHSDRMNTNVQNNKIANLLKNTQYLFSPSDCPIATLDDLPLIFVIVHIRHENANERAFIRKAWAKRLETKRHFRYQIRFVIGIDATGSPLDSLNHESGKHGDLIVGSFVDSYRNLTYKTAAAYEWVSKFCKSADYVIKMDEDVNIKNMETLENAILTHNRASTVHCRMIFVDSSPMRIEKWKVELWEYPEVRFPSYCSGSFYFMRGDVAVKIGESIIGK